MVLGLVLQISNGSVQISMAVISHHLDCIGEYLSLLGMHSEATAAGIMSTNILRLLARGNSSVAPCLALALDNLSRRYCHQMRCDLALQASQQSLDLCYNCSESSPDVDNRPLFLAALITHSSNLRLAGIPDAAISIAQEAVIVSQLILTKLVGLFTTKSGAQLVRPQDKWTAAKCCAAFFTLASAYSSAGRYYEAFLASQEGLETVVKFSGAVLAPIASDVDTAIDLLCRMAEAGELSRATLADNVVMFRNLARIYLEEFASPFLSILHAHVYFRGQADPSSHVPNELRIFLEPNPDSQPPLLVVLSDPATAIEDFNGVVEDAVYAFYASSVTFVEATSSLIQCFFISHFDRATMVLRKVGASLIANPSVSPGVLAGAVIEIFDTLQLVSHSEQSSLLEVMTDLIRHLCTLVGSQQASWKTRQHFTFALSSYFCIAWLGGRLDEALVLTYEAIKCLRSGSDNEEGDEELCDWLLCRSFILFDLGRFPEAAGVLQDIADDDIRRYTFVNFYHSLVRSRILRQFGKADEALHLLSERTSAVYPQYRENYGLLIELADIHLDLGNSRQALRDAERVVALYRASPIELISSQAEHVKYALARALNSLSNCLAAVGRNEEGLLAVQEAAALILPLNRTPLPIAWSTVLLRPQELAAITLCTLSLRLAALGNTQEALLNVQEAVNLCRELVLLAVRHKPFLASTLKNLSTQLWNVGRRDEAIAALKEVSALDNVDEP
ncbi:hypothetical protein C8R44DRAFT_241542 [Mycena epipterygia]|nr:hypothetical protein C8R44DRAFT_241542 [Mycena epipterygia]